MLSIITGTLAQVRTSPVLARLRDARVPRSMPPVPPCRHRPPCVAQAQGPGNGIAKTTYAASDPFPGLAFNLKYFPTTAAIDSCSGNYCKAGSFPDGEKSQGRAQLVDKGFYTQRNCALYSATSTSDSKSGATTMDVPSN